MTPAFAALSGWRPIAAGGVLGAIALGGAVPALAQESAAEPTLLSGLIAIFTGAGGGPREALAFAMVLAALVLAAVAVTLVVVTARGALAQGRRGRARQRDLERRLAELEALIAAEPQAVVTWRGASDPAPQVTSNLPTGAGVPRAAEALLQFDGWLDGASARSLAAAVGDLKSAGAPFSLFVTSAEGARLTAEGFAGAGSVALKLRELRGSALEALATADSQSAVEAEAANLKALLARAPLLAWVRDRDAQLVWVNEGYAEAVEAVSADAVVAAASELVPPEMRAQIKTAIAKGTMARQRVHAVVAGNRRSFDVVEAPSPQGSAGLAIDVTNLDALRDELDRHIAAHGRTLDQLATAVAIFGPDQRLKFFNAAYVHLWKLDEGWLRQEPTDGEVLDALRDASRLPEQADYRAWREKRLEAYKGIEAMEDWWHLPDGQTLRVVAEPQPFGGVTYLFENITEKIALESRFNSLTSVQRETLDNLHEGVALFGSDGRLKLSNPSFASIWKLEDKELESEPHMDAVIGACSRLTGDHAHWNELRASVAAFGDERQPVSGRIIRPDDKVVDYASVPLPDGATLFTYVDVTDSWHIETALRERNEALLAADRLKTAFISHVSYELRAPLTSIKGFAEMLAAELVGPVNDKQREYIGDIQSSSEKLHRLIDDILDLATIDAGVMELDLEPVDIKEALTSAGALLAERVQDIGLKLVYKVPDDIGTISADQLRLKQILYNLISNAIGFSKAGGKITLGARRRGKSVEFSVADQGRGIPADMQDRIFNRFETHTEGSSHRGSGLGLSVVKSFVELHGGEVSVTSEPGKGTKVTCRLPVEPQPVKTGTVAEAADEGDAARAQTDRLNPALPSL